MVLLLVAVEPSADAIGARLMAALRRRIADVTFVGAGGARMTAEGLVSAFDINPLSLLGVTEALRAFPLVLRRVRDLAELAERAAPRAAILIDAWGFNLRVARRLKALRKPPLVIKYVAPQVWATRPGRARTLAHEVDRLLTIHAFDAPYFERHGLPVDFVGNPALPRPAAGAPAGQSAIARDPSSLLLLPGSRPAEVARLMPAFGKAARLLRQAMPGLQFTLAPAEPVAAMARAAAERWALDLSFAQGEHSRREVMGRATVALACSGTITTELAAAGCPMVVAYRLSPITYVAARLLIRTRYITLVNIAADAEVAPEFIQGRCTGSALARAVGARLADPELRRRQSAEQFRALEIIAGGIDDPIAAAADAVVAALAEAGDVHPRVSMGA